MSDSLFYLDDGAQSARKALFDSIQYLSTLAARHRTKDIRLSLAALSEKLKKNRFNLAIWGQMKRGIPSRGARFGPIGNICITDDLKSLGVGSYLLAQTICWAQELYPEFCVADGELGSASAENVAH